MTSRRGRWRERVSERWRASKVEREREGRRRERERERWW